MSLEANLSDKYREFLHVIRHRSLLPGFLLRRVYRGRRPTFEDLSEIPADPDVPFLDRSGVDESSLSADQLSWRQNGVVVLKEFLPDELMNNYCRVRERLERTGGWPTPTPYMHIPEIKELSLYKPLMAKLKSLLGGDLFLHLNLTGWVSTQNDWHQDDYFNPPFINAHCAAVWMALDDIHPDSGPLEYLPGSHRWPLLRKEKIQKYLAGDFPLRAGQEGRPGENYHWAFSSGYFLTPAIDDKIRREDAKVVQFLGKKGDILIFHGRLVHRGGKPRAPEMLRKALISHYSVIEKRADLIGKERRHTNGESFAHFDHPLF